MLLIFGATSTCKTTFIQLPTIMCWGCRDLSPTYSSSPLPTAPWLSGGSQRTWGVGGGACLAGEGTLTSADVHFVERVLGRGQHAHVRPELLGQRLDDILRGCRARDPDTFCCKVPSRFILKIKPHHSMELQVLEENKTIHF